MIENSKKPQHPVRLGMSGSVEASLRINHDGAIFTFDGGRMLVVVLCKYPQWVILYCILLA